MASTLPSPHSGTVEDQLAALDRGLLNLDAQVNARLDQMLAALVAEIRGTRASAEPSRPALILIPGGRS
jgi:hypothetical protein